MGNRRKRGFAVPKTVRLRESAPPIEEAPAVEADSPKPGSDRQLRTYWVRGAGAAKIRWGEPNDFDRCVTHLGKFVSDSKGLCAEYHHEALGVWPGQEGPKKEAAEPEAAPQAVRLTEATTSGALTPSGGGRRYRARLIETPRWGSSGFYSTEVVGRDGPRIFPVGTHLYADHPSLAEETDRPERSIRDLAAQTVSPAVMEADGLYADIEVFPHAAPLIESLGAAIGLSIRAAGLAESGTAEGRSGPIITELTEGYSIDFVTRAGAGGKLVSLIESARSAGDALAAWTGHGHPGPDTAPDTPAPPDDPAELAEQTSASSPQAAPENPPNQEEPSMSGSQTAGVAPGAQAGQTPTVAGAPIADVVVSEAKRQVAEMQLAEAKTQVEGLRTQLTESERKVALAEARADKAEAELRTIKATEAARVETTKALSTSDLPEAAKVRVVEAVTRNVPCTDKGDVDTTALAAAITKAVDGEKAYIASVSESAGAGTPSGLGTAPAPLTESTAPSGVDFRAVLARKFSDLGMDDKSAALAARIGG